MKIFLSVLMLIVLNCTLASKVVDSAVIQSNVLSIDGKDVEGVIINNNFPEKSENYWGEIIPILTLLIGFFAGKIYDNWDKRKKEKEEGREWIETFLQLESPLNSQIESITEFLEKNPINVDEISSHKFQVSLDCIEFNYLNNKSITPYLRKKYRHNYSHSIKFAGKLKNTIRIIQSTSILYNKSFSDLTIKNKVHYDKFRENFSEFRNCVSEYLNEYFDDNNPTNEQNKFVKEIEILYDVYVINNFNFIKISEEFFFKYIKISIDVKNHPQISESLKLLTICDQSVKDIMSERESLRVLQMNIKETYNDCLLVLKNVISELRI